MSDIQIYLTIGIFSSVILLIAFDVIDMMIATLLGVSLMFAFGILGEKEMLMAARTAGGPLALLFGGMVVARVLTTTGIFENVGLLFLRATQGSGKRYLLLLVLLVAPICAFLPNATTVILLAPVIIRVAEKLDVDFVRPMIMTAIISNSAGLLTLVGDPATFLVGSSIGMTFGQYLRQVSLGGLLAVLAVVPLLPWLMGEVWRTKRALPVEETVPAIKQPWLAVLALGVLLIMVILFLVGEDLPTRIVPPEVSIIAASLALLIIAGAKIEPIENIIRDIDWKTLVFLFAIFCMVQGFTRTGLLQDLSLKMGGWFGTEFLIVALVLLAGIGTLSSLLANIPLVAVSLLMVKGYLVAAEVVPEIALETGFTDWPAAVLPVFIAMMFGATLGGNATLIGASANVVAAGICTNRGRRVNFATFMRLGLPITVFQLAISALYVLALSWYKG